MGSELSARNLCKGDGYHRRRHNDDCTEGTHGGDGLVSLYYMNLRPQPGGRPSTCTSFDQFHAGKPDLRVQFVRQVVPTHGIQIARGEAVRDREEQQQCLTTGDSHLHVEFILQVVVQ